MAVGRRLERASPHGAAGDIRIRNAGSRRRGADRARLERARCMVDRRPELAGLARLAGAASALVRVLDEHIWPTGWSWADLDRARRRLGGVSTRGDGVWRRDAHGDDRSDTRL